MKRENIERENEWFYAITRTHDILKKDQILSIKKSMTYSTTFIKKIYDLKINEYVMLFVVFTIIA